MSSFTPSDNDGIYMGYNQIQRLHCGLRWDPVQGSPTPADLDLVYATYDEFGRFMGAVSGKDTQRNDFGGSLYHSGDDADGAEDLDDERVTIDLFAIPQQIHHIFLMVEIQSDHHFGNVPNPQIRLSKGMDPDNILLVNLVNPDRFPTRSHIFVRLDRKPGGWLLTLVDDYPRVPGLPTWENELIRHLPERSGNAARPGDAPAIPKQDETVPLYYSKQAMRRIVCGLSWDARGAAQTKEDRTNERAGINSSTFDLDLSCILYDENGDYFDFVTSLAENAVDQSGAVYHSGDDTSGAGDGDDETISVELANLPDAVHHAVFVVDLKSAHTLGDVYNPQIRLFDGMSGRDQLDVRLDEGGRNNAYIFARISRTGDGEWVLHNITRYLDTSTVEDWTDAIRPHMGISG